jgi:hypothetical protein
MPLMERLRAETTSSQLKGIVTSSPCVATSIGPKQLAGGVAALRDPLEDQERPLVLDSTVMTAFIGADQGFPSKAPKAHLILPAVANLGRTIRDARRQPRVFQPLSPTLRLFPSWLMGVCSALELS